MAHAMPYIKQRIKKYNIYGKAGAMLGAIVPDYPFGQFPMLIPLQVTTIWQFSEVLILFA